MKHSRLPHQTHPPAVPIGKPSCFRRIGREDLVWLCFAAETYCAACLFGFDTGLTLLVIALVSLGLLFLWSLIRVFECRELALPRLLFLLSVPGLAWMGLQTGRTLDRMVVNFRVSTYDKIAADLLNEMMTRRVDEVRLESPEACIMSAWAGTDPKTGARVVAIRRRGCLIDRASMIRRSLVRYPDGTEPEPLRGECYHSITANWYEVVDCDE